MILIDDVVAPKTLDRRETVNDVSNSIVKTNRCWMLVSGCLMPERFIGLDGGNVRNAIRFMMVCIFLSGGIATSSFAGGFYVNGNASLVFVNETDITESGRNAEMTFDTGFGVGAGGGYDFNFARLEGEVGYRKNTINKLKTQDAGDIAADGDISALSFMVNGFFDFKNRTFITPYIGGGVGAARVDLSTSTAGDAQFNGGDDMVFAYQFGFGFGNIVTDRITFDLGYRYFATTDPKLGDTELQYRTHNLLLRIRYSF